MLSKTRDSLFSWLCLLFVTFLFVFCVKPANAYDITIAWDPNNDENLAGYILYVDDGLSEIPYEYVDTYPLEDIDPQNPSVRITDLSDDLVYYFVVTAYDADDNESDYSEPLLSCQNNCDLFEDVQPRYWAQEFINNLYENGITIGCSREPLRYCPEDTVTRAQVAVFLERGRNGSDYSPPDASGVFDDCPDSYWSADWIEQFYADGITGGCSTNPPLYCPGDNVTRAQMAVFLLRSMYGSSYTPPAATGIFSDVPVNYWAAGWIEQLYNEGITSGCSSNPPLFCPGDPVTRAQMAVFILRAFDL